MTLDQDRQLYNLKTAVAITMQTTIQRLGPIPNSCEGALKKILRENDDIALICFGIAIENCAKNGSYESLQKAIDDITAAQLKKTT